MNLEEAMTLANAQLTEHGRQAAINETFVSLVARLLALRARGVPIRLHLPDGVRLQGRLDDKDTWCNISMGKEGEIEELWPQMRMVYTNTSPGTVTITARYG